jgi:hypothetical protein
MKVYLAGPMRGYKDFNFPAFFAAAKYLRSHGHDVFSPAEKDIQRDNEYGREHTWQGSGDIKAAEAKGFDRRIAITDDLMYIIREAEAIALLPGWQASKGANAEYWTAQFLDLKIWELPEFSLTENNENDRVKQVSR